MRHRSVLLGALFFLSAHAGAAEVDERGRKSLAALGAVVEARCRRAAECGEIHPATLDLCVAATTNAGLVETIRIGLRFVPERWVSTEIRSAKARACSERFWEPEASIELFEFGPLRKLGERCLDDEDCVEGRCADRKDLVGGLCKPKIDDGGACRLGSECRSTSFCRTEGHEFRCAPKSRKGERCNSTNAILEDVCEPGLKCRPQGRVDRCLPEVDYVSGRAKLGARCEPDSDMTPRALACVDGLYCKEQPPSSGGGRCVPYRAEGQSCDEAANVFCGGPFLACDAAQHRCTRAHQPGSACSPNDEPIAFLWCDAGTLQVKRAFGAPCRVDAECAGICATGKCTQENDVLFYRVLQFGAAQAR